MAKKDDLSNQTVVVLAILVIFLSLLSAGLVLYELSEKKDADNDLVGVGEQDKKGVVEIASTTGVISLNIVDE